jgi:hypothetical protein
MSWDERKCTGCGTSLYACYDGPRYKGHMRCCEVCDHPSEYHRKAEEEAARVRAAALAKLTDSEKIALGIRP